MAQSNQPDVSGTVQQPVVLITGATGGLGPAVVEEFLRWGALVTGVARRVPGSDSRPGLRWLPADLSDFSQAQRVIQDVVQLHGKLDILVHLVGGFRGGKLFWETTAEDWEKMLSVNLLVAVHVLRAAIPVMLGQRRGRIVVTGSRAGAELAPRLLPYAVSKAALHWLVQGLARELEGTGVRINAVLPGIIDTPANRQAMPSADRSSWVKPESLAKVIRWLAWEEATDVHGALVPVYGNA